MPEGHLTEIVSAFTVGKNQAECSCGWTGPIRGHYADAHQDALRHQRDAAAGGPE